MTVGDQRSAFKIRCLAFGIILAPMAFDYVPLIQPIRRGYLAILVVAVFAKT